MPTAPIKVLLVEDDSRIRSELLEGLPQAGFACEVATTANDARTAMKRAYDVMLLDLGLPDGDGLDLCREARELGLAMSILILTARHEPEQRVKGLEVGADDYISKPFYLPELVARIRTVLRRVGRQPGSATIQCGNLRIDPAARVATVRDAPVHLKPREFDLLLFFAESAGRAWTRSQILNRVWGGSYDGDTRTVDSHVRRLRTAVEEDPSDPQWIQTVWGVGYRMREP